MHESAEEQGEKKNKIKNFVIVLLFFVLFQLEYKKQKQHQQ